MLRTTVYTADRGYSWSNVPEGVTTADLEKLLALVTGLRPEFPSETDVTQGAVSDGRLIAVFSVRTVAKWDFEGRSADYVAIALVDREQSANVDFKVLLENRFFKEPVKRPPPFMMYEGPDSQHPAVAVPGRLLSRNQVDDLPFSAAGSLMASYVDKSSQWTISLDPTSGLAEVKTAPWNLAHKAN